jgi:hypothetical protein
MIVLDHEATILALLEPSAVEASTKAACGTHAIFGCGGKLA